MALSVLAQTLTLILSPLYILRGAVDISWLGIIYQELNLLSIPYTFLEILILVTVILTFIDFRNSNFNFKLIQTKYDFLIMLFLVASIIALVKSYNLMGGIGIFKAYIVEPILFYYCLIFTSRKYNTKHIYIGFLGAGLWLSFLSLVQKITGNFSLAPHEIIQGRIAGVYNSANSLALFLGPIILLNLGLILTIGKNLLQKILVILFIFLLIIFYWTRSRGGIAAEVAGLSVLSYGLLVLKIKSLKKYWYVVPAVFSIILIIFVTYFYKYNNFFPIDFTKPYSLGDTIQIRYFIWAGTINLLKDQPFFGAGLDGFKTLYSNQYRLPVYQEQFQYPHNLILTIWSEMGLIGLFAFLLILINSIFRTIKRINTSPIPTTGLIFICVFVYWLVHGLVDVPYFKNDLSIQFWSILALVEIWTEEKT